MLFTMAWPRKHSRLGKRFCWPLMKRIPRGLFEKSRHPSPSRGRLGLIPLNRLRKPRVHLPGALYHVIVRGNKGQRVFRREADFRLYLRLLGEYKEVFEFALCAYALVPTRVHLLVEARGTHASGVM